MVVRFGTCAITRHPIMEKQPVFMIVLKENIPSYIRHFWLLNEPADAIEFVCYGTYNGYGWINQIPVLNDFCISRSIFVHEQVMEKIIEVIPPKDCSNELYYYSHILSLCQFALNMCLNLNLSTCFKRDQHKPIYLDLLLQMTKEQILRR